MIFFFKWRLSNYNPHFNSTWDTLYKNSITKSWRQIMYTWALSIVKFWHVFAPFSNILFTVWKILVVRSDPEGPHFARSVGTLRPTVRKNCSTDWEKLLKFEAEGRESLKLRSLLRTIYSSSERSKQFLVTECFFNLFLEVSHVS